MKLTDKAIAEFYGVSRGTIMNWKNSNDKRKNLYDAARYYYISKLQLDVL